MRYRLTRHYRVTCTVTGYHSLLSVHRNYLCHLTRFHRISQNFRRDDQSQHISFLGPVQLLDIRARVQLPRTSQTATLGKTEGLLEGTSRYPKRRKILQRPNKSRFYLTLFQSQKVLLPSLFKSNRPIKCALLGILITPPSKLSPQQPHHDSVQVPVVRTGDLLADIFRRL